MVTGDGHSLGKGDDLTSGLTIKRQVRRNLAAEGKEHLAEGTA